MVGNMQTEIAEILSDAIVEHGGATAVARLTGLHQPPLTRFCNGQQGLNLDTVQVLCDFLGLKLVKDRRRKTKLDLKGLKNLGAFDYTNRAIDVLASMPEDSPDRWYALSAVRRWVSAALKSHAAVHKLDG